MSECFARALATLEAGANFFGAGLRDVRRPIPPSALRVVGQHRAKVIGNGLRELDRFLNRLVDEALYVRRQAAFPGERNTANKLRTFFRDLDRPDVDGARLRALGRSRECMFHCEGRVRRGDGIGNSFMTAGWPDVPGSGAPLRRFAIGETMIVNEADLADIAAFYLRLVREIGASAMLPDARPRGSSTVANGGYCNSAARERAVR